MKKKAKTKEKTDPYAHLDQSDLLGTNILKITVVFLYNNADPRILKLNTFFVHCLV